jgi:hypothetical protein
MGFTKLFSDIVMSTIWREDDKTRILWITILAIKDSEGNVMASIPGLADAARITISECEKALQKLLSPDEYSRSQEYNGRRIEEIDGGWHVLNHDKYRDKRPSRAEYFREYRKRNATVVQQKRNKKCSAQPHTDTDTDTDTKKNIYKKKFKPPALEEFIRYVTDNQLNIRNPESLWHGYEDCDPPWHDTKGNPVKNWKMKLRTLSNFGDKALLSSRELTEEEAKRLLRETGCDC